MYANSSEAITKREVHKVTELDETLIKLSNEQKQGLENIETLVHPSFELQANEMANALGYDKLTPPDSPQQVIKVHAPEIDAKNQFGQSGKKFCAIKLPRTEINEAFRALQKDV